MKFTNPNSGLALWFATAVALSLTACNRSNPNPQTPPKTNESQPSRAALPPGHPPLQSNSAMNGQSLPTAAMAIAKNPEWTVPKDWQPGQTSGIRRGSWIVKDTEGHTAEIVVTVFPGDVGGPLANINRWRAQIGLGPIQENEVGSVSTNLVFGAITATVVDLANPTTPAGSTQPQRLIVATIPHEGNSWFFKMTGAAPVVEAQKKAFLDFVQSVKF